MDKSFKEIFVKDILKNKALMFSTIIITILAFGFTVTNYSMGVDDPAAGYYLDGSGWGSMIQQGRLLHVIFDKLTGAVEFIPFFNDFVGATLFMLSALMFCGLFLYVSEGKFSTVSLIIFNGIYLSFSIVNEKFIYNLDVIVTMLSYVLVAASLQAGYSFVFLKDKRAFIRAVLTLIFGIGAYESFIFVYICGVFIIFLIKGVVCGERLRLKSTVISGLWFLLILLLSAAVYYSAVAVVQHLTHQAGIFERNSVWSGEGSFLFKIKNVLKNIIYSLKNISYLPILELDLFMAAGLVISVFFAVKRRSVTLLLCYCGLLAGCFGIYFAMPYFAYRVAQTFCLFAAFVALIIVHCFENRALLKRVVYLLFAVLIFIQLADLNLRFYNDYVRYKKEEFAINTIATRLVAECDVDKPVVFVNKPSDYYMGRIDANDQSNGYSMLYWTIGAFNNEQNPMIYEVFRLHGYDFLKTPTPQQSEEAQERAEEMAAWPAKDSIKEFEDIIVVNFGKAG